jgi:Fic family protein
MTHQQWWTLLKVTRLTTESLALADRKGKRFAHGLPAPIPEHLHFIDMHLGGAIGMADPIANPDTRDRYIVSSLIEEAITSSQLEGAHTTHRVAKEMIRTNRPPRDKSEQMILNNYLTMRRVQELRNEPMTPDLLMALQRLVTSQTLDDPTAAGRFRRAEEHIVVSDHFGETIFHEPPPAAELPGRIKKLCDFANADKPFVHPVIRSIILHFWLAYDHPFADGNGRTARALFYWSMLKHRYWLAEFISISSIIRKAPAKYGRAFLYTETDDNDLTYFILYHLDVIRRAIDELHAYIDRKTRELEKLDDRLRGFALLNHRQRTLLGHALRHPNQLYTIESHRVSHNVVYDTARRDLMDLQKRGLLQGQKRGKTWVFRPQPDLEARLAEPD